MLRILIGILYVCCTIGVWGEEQKIIDIIDDNLKCGPITCPLHESHMCFYTSKLTTDRNRVSFITTCGTCLSINGSIIRDNCATESTTLTNYTNRMSMNLFNSTLDSSRIRNGVVSLMLNEMNNGASSYFPSAHMAPPTPPLPPQGQPVVVVQPPAQYITVNSDMPFRGRSYQPYHADRFIPNDICDPPRPDCIPRKRFHPNELPPQADKMFRIMGNMKAEIIEMTNALEDALAGQSPGYLDNRSFPPGKTPFPVWTPVGGKK